MVWSVITTELATDERCLDAAGPGRIVDLGGGTGGFAVPLAQAGHDVTVIDPSPNALAGLTRRAVDAGVADRVTAVQGDTDTLTELVEADSVRLVLCHNVLEMVDSPAGAIGAIAAVLAPGGAVSLLVANRAGAVLSRALGGHLAAATAMLADPDGRSGPRDTLLRRFDPDGIQRLLTDAGLTAEQRHGVQVVTDLMTTGPDTESGAARAVRDFEELAAGVSPYRDVAADLHVLARRPMSRTAGRAG